MWPIEKFRKLSSAFGEYRNFHFHSGIDIPTQKKTGFKVMAPESGWVFRIYTSWWGYGKAVYLKLDDGRLVLFGHLSDFSPGIKEFVEKEQLKSKSYFQNIFLDKDQMRIKKGELIGFSGETGAGAPHLHFELRDDKNQPLNPLKHGFWVADSLPPVIKKIVFRPMGINSYVEGKEEVAILNLIPDSTGESYALKEKPILSGKIGLEISAYDRMNKRKLGIYKASLYLDNELIFSSRYDTLNFETTWMVTLDRDFQLLNQGKGHFYKLYVNLGNELNLYTASEPDKGIVNTEKSDSLSQKIYTQGTHRIRVTVEDVWGNLSSAGFSVIFDKKPEIKITEIAKSAGGYEIKGKVIDNGRYSEMEIDTSPIEKLTWDRKKLINSSEGNEFFWVEDVKVPSLFRVKAKDDSGLESNPAYFVLGSSGIIANPGIDEIKLDLDYCFEDGFLNFRLGFNSILSKKPELSLKVGGFEFQPLLMREIDEKSYKAVYPFSETKAKELMLKVRCQSVFGDSATFVNEIPLSIATTLYGGEAVSQDDMAKIRIDSGAVYKDIQLKIEKSSPRIRLGKKCEVYSFEPKDVPFAKYAWISLSYKGEKFNPEKLALYEYKNRSWRFVGNELDSDEKTVSGKVRQLSGYALLEDLRAPRIKIIYPKRWQRIKNRSPLIYSKIWEDLSGLDIRGGITVTVDDQWIIPEYDPEKGILKTRPSQPLSWGWHTLKIVVRDQAGNQKTVERKFKVIR
ncbi:MAG: M23 family metallopeptidase [Candidatus Zixiibacteriota bacterium]